ncbi:biopolymer transporter ExbD [Rasiella rasia]|uniref:Biopolymer transporter ExbD n=1 Tax=Rasiella rasia TaxID=2744027 RepID=A0A6G6GPM9_9FLAO|nr:biopolymer transporter ExbD [Rasiella rasia]QIE59671.1 biopolymer transporter ExbD [Rasiella rasia]
MSKFKKKKGGDLPAVNTASLPDIVFMLLFFFMVVTVLRNNDLMIKNELPKANEVEKLKKDRSVFIYAGKPSDQYKDKFGTESRIQIGDKFTDVSSLQFALTGAREKLRPELQDYVVVALKVDKETNTGIVSDIKEELRELNMVKIIYIAAPGSELDQK